MAKAKDGKKDIHKQPKVSNEVYEAEMFRLQTELVKMQEWTKATGVRIVVIFEGRDAAGKGGTIADQRVFEPAGRPDLRSADPPTARKVSGTTSATSPSCQLEARRALRPFLVQPGRRGKGDGLLHPTGVCAIHAPDSDLRTDADRRRHPAAQVLVFGVRRRAAQALPVPSSGSHAAMEIESHGSGVHQPLERTTRAPRTR